MAGESPDKSVDEGAAGAGRDPRLSVFRPRDPRPEPEAGDPLREAVAAWVASSTDDVDGADDADGSDDSDVSDSSDASGSSDGSDDSDGAAADGAAADDAAADSERTAVFRAVKPAADKPAVKADADKPAESGQRTTAFGVVKPAAKTDADEKPAERDSGSGSGSASTKPGSSAADASGADSERTAVFRAVKPAAKADEAKPVESAKPAAKTDADEKPAERDSGSGSGSASTKPGSSAADASGADSERTAVFRAVKPAAKVDEAKPVESAKSGAVVKPGVDQRTTAFGVVKPGSASADESSDSERTAVFRAVKPAAKVDEAKPVESAKSGAVVKPGVDQRTTAFGVVKPGSASADESSDSERTAVFRAVKPAAKVDEAKPVESAKSGAVVKPGVDQRTTAFGVVKPGSASADESSDSERTAVFRAVKPAAKVDEAKPVESAKPGAAVKPGADQRTTAFGVVKPDPGQAAPAKPAPAKPAEAGKRAGSSSTGTGSAFVPLRGDGVPAAKPPVAPRPATPEAKPRVSLEPNERTTQQPLPPKPPLDMLADLTNNPPPPPSPLRTAARRIKIYAPIVVLLAVILSVVQLVRPLPEPTLVMTAKNSYTFDGGAPALPWPKEGQAFMAAAGLGTVGTFGEQKPVAIGSVAKAMTAYVILKGHPLKKGEKGAMIDVDKTAVEDGKKESEGESTVNTLKEGEQVSEYDALAAIMIPSANNVARLLARWDTGGDQEAFVRKMNDTAKELGMTNTTYTDPSGLDATTVSTAEDQVKLGLKIVEMPELIAITRLPSWTDQSGKAWRNYNDLIPFNGSLGIKTGSTTKAGGNLLFAAEKKVGKTNQLIVGAVLGQHGVPILGTAISASKDIMLATQKALTNAPVVKKGDVVGYVDDGLGGHTPVIATADVEAVGWPTLTVDVKLGSGGNKLPQTAGAGTEVGVLTVGEGASQVKVPVALRSDLAAPGIGSKLTRVG